MLVFRGKLSSKPNENVGDVPDWFLQTQALVYTSQVYVLIGDNVED